MRIRRNEVDRILEIWLSNAEEADDRLRASLKPLFQESKRLGYMAVVYESGDRDLADGMRELLRHNREVIARRQLAEEEGAISVK